MIWMALALSAETAIFALAGFSWLRSRGYTFAEAGAGAILAAFMTLSLIHQISYYLGSPLTGVVLECTGLATLVFMGLRRWPGARMSRALGAVAHLIHRERFSGVILMVTWSGMAVLAVSSSQYSLTSAYPWVGWATEPFSGAALSALNIQALFYTTGRFGLDPGACGFGLLAHMAVGFSTYALARRYAWPPMALTVTLIVLSMPRLVGLGVRPTPELVSTAAITFSMVLLYRLVEQHRPEDLLLFLLCTLFSIDSDPMGFGLALILLLLLVVVVVRRHGWIVWRELLAARPLWTALAVVPILAMAQLPVGVLNAVHGHPLLGMPNALADNGLLGGAANLILYLLISVDITEPMRQVFFWLTGGDVTDLLSGAYAFSAARLAGHVPERSAFIPVFTGGGPMGFGPCVPFFILPAMVHAFLRGPRRLKALGVAWGGYLYLAALLVAWPPDRLGVLTPLYGASGFVVAFSLPPHRLRRRGMRLLQALTLLLVALSLYLSP